MPKPIDHFALAEKYLDLAHKHHRQREQSTVVDRDLAEAQVHATLALAQATNAARTIGGSVILSGKSDWP